MTKTKRPAPRTLSLTTLASATGGLTSSVSFNLSYYELQFGMEDADRSDQLITNISKTKNDTVTNTISNVR